jgi:hypothetical protein
VAICHYLSLLSFCVFDVFQFGSTFRPRPFIAKKPGSVKEMETTSVKPGQTFVENWIVIHLCRILKYFYFNISYKGKIDSLIISPPLKLTTTIQGQKLLFLNCICIGL